jgi:hypothetical protein
MRITHPARWSRREFLGGLTATGVAGFVGLQPRLVGAEPPPETTRIRLRSTPSLCLAPMYVAEELLYLEGFTEVQYVKQVSDHRGSNSQAIDFESVKIYSNFTVKIKNPGKSNT